MHVFSSRAWCFQHPRTALSRPISALVEDGPGVDGFHDQIVAVLLPFLLPLLPFLLPGNKRRRLTDIIGGWDHDVRQLHLRSQTHNRKGLFQSCMVLSTVFARSQRSVGSTLNWIRHSAAGRRGEFSDICGEDDGQVRFQIIGTARIENVGKSQSCMGSKLPMI